MAAACGSLQPYALVVNGSRIQQHDIDNELKAIRANGRYLDAIDPSRRQVLGSGTGTFNSDFTAFILNEDLDFELVHQEVLKRKLKVTQTARDQAKATVIQQVNGQDTFNAFPKWYQDKLQAYRTTSWTGWTPVPGGMIFNFTRGNYLKVRPVA